MVAIFIDQNEKKKQKNQKEITFMKPTIKINNISISLFQYNIYPLFKIHESQGQNLLNNIIKVLWKLQQRFVRWFIRTVQTMVNHVEND